MKNKLYLLDEIINSPLITPFNLMSYFLDECYTSISFVKEEDHIKALISMNKENRDIHLTYVFDFSYNLIEIYEGNNPEEIVFSRKNETKKLVNKINNESKVSEVIDTYEVEE